MGSLTTFIDNYVMLSGSKLYFSDSTDYIFIDQVYVSNSISAGAFYFSLIYVNASNLQIISMISS